jgi:hypothetical protein
MQLRFATQDITGEDYVSSRLWQRARLSCCPLHPRGGCGFAAHGTYERVNPPGTRIRRWYCRLAGVTFSALPDFLCARLSGTLPDLERAVRLVESAPSLEKAVRIERPEIDLPGVLRFFRRRVTHTHRALSAIKGLYPDTFAGVVPTVSAFRQALGLGSGADIPPPTTAPPNTAIPTTDSVLVRLREFASRHLAMLTAPLGSNPVRIAPRQPQIGRQHGMGPDPLVVLLDPAGCPGQSP